MTSLQRHTDHLSALYLKVVAPVSGSTYAAEIKRSDDTWNALTVARHYERALTTVAALRFHV